MATAPVSDRDDVVGEPGHDLYCLAIQQTEPLRVFVLLYIHIASTL